jgi:hypothetical protein
VGRAACDGFEQAVLWTLMWINNHGTWLKTDAGDFDLDRNIMLWVYVYIYIIYIYMCVCVCVCTVRIPIWCFSPKFLPEAPLLSSQAVYRFIKDDQMPLTDQFAAGHFLSPLHMPNSRSLQKSCAIF